LALARENGSASRARYQAQAGFTLDIEVRPATGEEQWVRLITAPVVEGGKVVRLHGLKIAL
jgi:hypothetical protein